VPDRGVERVGSRIVGEGGHIGEAGSRSDPEGHDIGELEGDLVERVERVVSLRQGIEPAVIAIVGQGDERFVRIDLNVALQDLAGRGIERDQGAVGPGHADEDIAGRRLRQADRPAPADQHTHTTVAGAAVLLNAVPPRGNAPNGVGYPAKYPAKAAAAQDLR
jgi:hypothetical protein